MYNNMPFKNGQAARADRNNIGAGDPPSKYDRLTAGRKKALDEYNALPKKTAEAKSKLDSTLSSIDKARKEADSDRFSVDSAKADAKKNMAEVYVDGKKTRVATLEGENRPSAYRTGITTK